MKSSGVTDGLILSSCCQVAIKTSVYVLPPTAERHEDFQWIVREIVESGGEAFVSEASLVGDGLTDDDVRARFNAVRDDEYHEIRADVQLLLKAVNRLATGNTTE